MAHQNEQKQEVAVVIAPLPAQGHLNQLLHLSRLITSYNISVHFVGSSTHIRQAKLRVHGWNPNSTGNKIHFHDFQIPEFSSPPPNPSSHNKFPAHLLPSFYASSCLREPLAAFLRSLSSESRRVVVINDSLMGSVVQDVTSLPNGESYTFHSVSAFALFLFMCEETRGSRGSNVEIPGEIPSLEGCFTNEMLSFISAQYEFKKFSSGTLYNTSKVIEGPFLDLLAEKDGGHKKHWSLGPFNPVKIPEKIIPTKRHFCLEWLDKQEARSVLYVSFGTTTAMEGDQIKELATGLERSKQIFIWVLRDADKGDVFQGGEEKRDELPRGFEARVRKMGLVVRDWAPQLEILNHPSTGGFMSHCGWNSCMESITMGVPMAAWPMHSDQPRNTVLIAKVLRIGIVVRDWGRRHELVTSITVEKAVKKLMASREGDEIRKRAAELSEEVRRSAGDGGVSRLELDSFIAHITR